ncbi:NADH-quinone oxidoreductase subunit C [Streptomyces sp. NPDC089799]|uniref:NADH-quinone oxidoreductase subunit C n=1 Tax=Streptomyces sp. NPDC089799 TaxID=3155066 RepID=UPI003429C9A2
MNLYDSLPDAAPEIFGAEAVAELSYDVLTVDVPVGSWISALETARDKLGCTYFDWLSAVDEPGTGFRICAHVVALEGHRVRRLLLRTTVPHSAPALPSAVAVYAGASWHERETYEMFGVTFTDHPHLVPLLLPENFEGHPLRKDFVLAARVAKAWPGAKEPGEGADSGGPKRRTMLPPGVPDPNDWGPLKGQLPPAPARPARTPRAAGDRPARAPREGAPVRRTRTAAEGSVGQAPGAVPAEGAVPVSPAAEAPATEAPAAETPATETPARPARRTRTTAQGSASQSAAAEGSPTESGITASADSDPTAPPARPARRSRSAADGSASQTPAAAAPAEGEDGTAAERPAARRTAPRSSDAPWHNPKPAFDEPSRPARTPAPAEPPAEPAEPAEAAKQGTPAEPTEAPAPATPAEQPAESAEAGGDGERGDAAQTTTRPDPDNGGDA